MIRRISLLVFFILTLITTTVEAVSPEKLPRPHLGYGIHVAPYTNANLGYVDTLRMNWVKVYEPFQVRQFSSKQVLYRMDLGWPSNWDQFRAEIRNRALEVVSYGVDAIEIHNEPNLRSEWYSTPNAWEYTRMLRVAYTEIKAVAPQVTVVSGGLAPTVTTGDGRAVSDLEFADEMFANGAGQYFDVFGYHPYGYNSPPEQEPSPEQLNYRRVELIRQLMREYDLTDKPIWLTEFGWLRNPSEDGVYCSPADPSFRDFAWMQLDGRTQADYIVRAFDFADRNWEWAGPMFLWNLNWSMLPDEALPQCSHMRWFALLTAEGEPTYTFNRVAAMPRRPARNIPQMALNADQMAVETGITCPGVVQVGQFEVLNIGYPGEFTAVVEPVQSLTGPTITVTPSIAEIGDVVTVYADTTGLTEGYYLIYINVSANIAGQNVAQNLRGYVIVSDSYAACY